MLRSWPPSLTWPRTLNPYPDSDFMIRTTRGPEVTKVGVWLPEPTIPDPLTRGAVGSSDGGAGRAVSSPSFSAIFNSFFHPLSSRRPSKQQARNTRDPPNHHKTSFTFTDCAQCLWRRPEGLCGYCQVCFGGLCKRMSCNSTFTRHSWKTVAWKRLQSLGFLP